MPPMPATDPETFEVHVFGWSRGFVAFGSDGGPGIGSTAPATLAATSSADGLSWTAPRGIALTGLDDRIDIVKVVEGPAGLVAVGQVPQGTCGGPSTVGALWTSTDGHAWHRVALPKAFSAVQVDMLDAGSAGYIASNPTYDNTAPVVWLSQDGRTWRSTPLSRSTFGKVIVDGTTSFAGGYVLAGAVVGEGGCGGPALVTPSIWWSADGDAWSRSPLSGATPKDNAYMTVSRISDHAVVANARTYDAATDSMSHQVWLTGDGRHWAPVAAPSTLNDNRILTDGARGMIVLEPVDNVGPPTLAAVGDDLAVTILRQTGPGPLADESIVGWTSALGPTGIVTLTADKGHLWLGVPAG